MSKRKSKYRNGAQIYRSRKDMVDGPLGEIWMNFFGPILSEKDGMFEDRESQAYFLDILFGCREITFSRAKKNFNCPGRYLNYDITPEKIKSNYEIKKDSRLCVRNDSTQAFVDLETEDERVFRMSNKQYAEISRYLAQEH